MLQKKQKCSGYSHVCKLPNLANKVNSLMIFTKATTLIKQTERIAIYALVISTSMNLFHAGHWAKRNKERIIYQIYETKLKFC